MKHYNYSLIESQTNVCVVWHNIMYTLFSEPIGPIDTLVMKQVVTFT